MKIMSKKGIYFLKEKDKNCRTILNKYGDNVPILN